MPKIVDADRKREEILEAAAATFARLGRRASLDQVAARAGMRKSSIYHYFTSREALVAALVDKLLGHERELFAEAAADSGSARQKLDRLVDGLAALLSQWSEAGVLLFDFVRDPRGRRRMRDTLRAARSSLARLIAEGQRAGEFRPGSPEAMATLVLAVVDGLLLQALLDPQSPAARVQGREMRDAIGTILLAKVKTR